MLDLNQPVPLTIVIYSILFIFILVAISLFIVNHYKKKNDKKIR
jgi:hypothetical protein